MYELFKGYVPTKGKKCIMPYKDKTSSELMTFKQVQQLDEYAGILNTNTILVDIDDKESSDKLMNIVEDLQLNCRVYQTTRGRHFLFRNTDVQSCSTGVFLAIGLKADIKVGCKNSYSVLKYNGEERFIEWEKADGVEYDTLPKWLLKIKASMDFLDMGKGDGRNQALFNYILTLQSNGFSNEEARQTIRLINKYIFKVPLSDSELEVILRDEAFDKPIFFDKTTFLFDKFAKYLMNNNHIVKIDNQLHIYKDGVYSIGYQNIEATMINLIPMLKDVQRKEVLKYLELIAPSVKVSDANYIAFKNGIYNLAYGTLEPFSPDIVITNKIPHNFNKDAYHEVLDKTLDKIAVNDKEIRALLEESIGYAFYRRNELGKAFVFTGINNNGKSTFLDVVTHILGTENISTLDLDELDDRFSTAMMLNKLANIGDDIADEFLKGRSVATFKKVVTGNRIKAEFKGRDAFDFNPYVKLFLSANEIPKMRDKTGAVIRRLVIIPCNARFTKDDPDYDPFIKYKLIEEEALEYAIVLGIQGLTRVIGNNAFTESKQVNEALGNYELENNPLLSFIKDMEFDGKPIVNSPTNEVYLKYDKYCHDNNYQSVGKVSFSKQICSQLNLQVVSKKIDGQKYRVFVEK